MDKWNIFFKRTIRLSVCALVLFGLTSCEMGVRVSVDGDLSNPRFSFRPYNSWDSSRVCIDYLDLREGSADESAPRVWFIYMPNGCFAQDGVSYLGPTPGAVVRQPPKPLKAGVVYVVVARGSAIVGGCAFVYRDGRYQMLKDRCP